MRTVGVTVRVKKGKPVLVVQNLFQDHCHEYLPS